MKHKGYQFTTKNRRGLSTIVGGLIFVVLMVATFSVLGIALSTQTDIVTTSRDVADIDLKQQQEEFTMNAFTTGPNGTAVLSVNVDNLGRILVPEFLRDFAGLKTKVVLAGVQNRVEIWNDKAWGEYKKRIEKQADALAEKLGEIGMI